MMGIDSRCKSRWRTSLGDQELVTAGLPRHRDGIGDLTAADLTNFVTHRQAHGRLGREMKELATGVELRAHRLVVAVLHAGVREVLDLLPGNRTRAAKQIERHAVGNGSGGRPALRDPVGADEARSHCIAQARQAQVAGLGIDAVVAAEVTDGFPKPAVERSPSFGQRAVETRDDACC
jgi:hypothetical protein